jgi:hypothetical protein
MDAEARRGGWRRVDNDNHYYCPFIATALDSQGTSGKTKYKCINYHSAKTVYVSVRATDKHTGIARSPTVPVQQTDTSTTYDVDYDARDSRGQTKLSCSSGGVD